MFHFALITGAASAEGADMGIIIEPVLKRPDAYPLDTSTAANRVSRGYPYRRIEDANYVRNGEIVDIAYLAANNPWLQCQLHTPLKLGNRPFVVGRRPVTGEVLPPWQPDLILDDTRPFRLSRNHFMIEQRDKSYHLRDLGSTLGTIVNGQPISDYPGIDDVPLQPGENEVIAGACIPRLSFSVSIP